MPESARMVTTDSEIDAALKRATAYAKFDRYVVKATYLDSADKLRLVLDDGAICSIPRRLIQGLSGVRKKEKLSQMQIINLGKGLLWPLLDVAHSVPGLLTGVYGSPKWMEQLKSESKSMRRGIVVGIDSRHRDLDGNIREKSGNTLVGTLRKTYGEDFLSDWRSDAKLSSVRQETDMSLNEIVRQYRIGKRLPSPQGRANGYGTMMQQ